MGQAKNRGSKEERIKEGLEKKRIKDEETAKKLQESWNNMTPEKRKKTLEYLAMVNQFKKINKGY